MFERFLERLSKTEYKDRFVIKGGVLVASIIGIDIRSTMDLDTTVINFLLTEENVMDAIQSIFKIDLDDGVYFEFKTIQPIRKDDLYGGYCVRIDAIYDTIITPLSIDISTGDVITPAAKKYEILGMFDQSIKIELWGYNIETILAEKLEAILSRGIYSTRMKDYYDIFILSKRQNYDSNILKKHFLKQVCIVLHL